MTHQLIRLAIVALTIVASATLISGQTNLLKNPNADLQSRSWRVYGETAIETCATANPCFVVRNGGYFLQDVALPDGAVGPRSSSGAAQASASIPMAQLRVFPISMAT